jgi:hypothetical protein
MVLRSRTAVFLSAGIAVFLCLAVSYAGPSVFAESRIEPDSDAGRDASLVAADTAAMDTMMAAMAVKPSGAADYDFAAAMIPHHQGAIDMAMAELKFGKNEQLRRIAQEIIVDQEQEIAVMRMAIGCSGAQSMPPAVSGMQKDQ